MNSIDYISEIKKDFDTTQGLIIQNEPSAAMSLSVYFSKILILTCASTYEQKMQEAYIKYAQKEAENYGVRPHRFGSENKDMNVYQRFNFSKITNTYEIQQLKGTRDTLEGLKFFGDKFYNNILDEVVGDVEKEDQVAAFQEIFAIRNLIAHQAFVEFSNGGVRGKTFSDILLLHNKASLFVDYLVAKFV